MSLVKTTKVQVGISGTPANNYTLAADGTGKLEIKRGNDGAETATVLTVNADSTIVGNFPGGGVLLGTGTPLVENGAGSAGVAITAAREDHVHPAGPTTPLGSALPLVEGTAAAGVSTNAAREDHVHPAGPTTPLSNALPLVEGTASAGTSTEAARADHVHPAGAGGGGASGPAVGAGKYLFGAATVAGNAVYTGATPAEVTTVNISRYDSTGADMYNVLRAANKGDTLVLQTGTTIDTMLRAIITFVVHGATYSTFFVIPARAWGANPTIGTEIDVRIEYAGQRVEPEAFAENARRYWRVRVVDSESTTVRVAGMKFAGGQTPAMFGDITASDGVPTLEYLFDLNPATDWVAAENSYIQFDAGTGVYMAPTRLELTASATTGHGPNKVMISSSVDGVLWTDVLQYISPTPWTANETRSIYVGYQPSVDGYGSGYGAWVWTSAALNTPPPLFTIQRFAADAATTPENIQYLYISMLPLGGISRRSVFESLVKDDGIVIDDYETGKYWRFAMLVKPNVSVDGTYAIMQVALKYSNSLTAWPTDNSQLAVNIVRQMERPTTPLETSLGTGYAVYKFGAGAPNAGYFRYVTGGGFSPRIYIDHYANGGTLNFKNQLNTMRNGDQLLLSNTDGSKVYRLSVTTDTSYTDFTAFYHTFVSEIETAPPVQDEEFGLQIIHGSVSYTGQYAGSLSGYSTSTIPLTNGQTIVTVPNGYTGASILVFLNGVLLEPGADWGGDGNSEITLTNPIVGSTSSLVVSALRTLNIQVSTTPPANPDTGDIWIDIS